MLATSTGLTITTPRGEVQCMTSAAFADHFGVEPPDVSRGARLAAVRFVVRDPAVVASILKAAGNPANEHRGRLVISPQTAMGAFLAFEPR